MDIGHFFDVVSEMLRRGAPVLTGFLFGLATGFLIFLPRWFWKKVSGKSTADTTEQTLTTQCETLQAEKRSIEEDRDAKSARIDELTSQLETHKEELNAKSEEADTLLDEKKTLQSELDQLIAQLEKLTKSDGDIWQRPPIPDKVPRFRTLTNGKPPIIAVVNLKGGVGKTTITANLAAAAMHLGQNSLLVDLDYQNSLSGLTLPPQLRKDLSDKGQVVSKLIDSPEPTGADVLRLAQRINGTNSFVLATNEDLSGVETQVMAQWITEGTPDDVRFRLRRALHADEVQSKFDLILIDCPPRLTTACINALACCDYVLIPALLDSVSAEAVPRLLRWLRMFKNESQICPHLSILGVVGNRARNSQGMSPKQQNIWTSLAGECFTAWTETVYQFQTTVPDSVGFADAANDNRFAAGTDKLRPVFLDLLSELQRRIPFHAGQGSPAVSR